jgi:hypothetical protein
MTAVEMVFTLLIIVDIGLTIVNLVILGLAVKLYTDQTKQRIFKERLK